MSAPDIAAVAKSERQYAQAIDLVQKYRAASIPLVQRHLRIGDQDAEALLQRMAQETTIVRRMPNGLYLFTGDAIGCELNSLHGFVHEVLDAVASGQVDARRLKEAAVRFGIADDFIATRRCGEQCLCTVFPTRCLRSRIRHCPPATPLP